MNTKANIRLGVKDIIFENEDFIVINKQPHWPIFRAPGEKGLIEVLKSYLKQRDSLINKPIISSFLPLKEIKEGIVVFSKNKKSQQICEQLRKEKSFELDMDNGISKKVSFFTGDKEESFTYQAKISENNLLSSKRVYYIFNKPYNVLCQFTKQSEHEVCLGDFNLPSGIYPAGRLDKDSEGLLLLTNDGSVSSRITSPKYSKEKTYLIQVEGIPTEEQLVQLEEGVIIKGGYQTLPCKVKFLKDFDMPKRNPPIRERKNIPTSWLEIKITEGKNRQVRRMSAAVGLPTLRLVRIAINDIVLPRDLAAGEFIQIEKVKL